MFTCVCVFGRETNLTEIYWVYNYIHICLACVTAGVAGCVTACVAACVKACVAGCVAHT